jgi:hypothetical protein
MVPSEKVADGSPIARRKSIVGMEKASQTEISKGLEDAVGAFQPDFVDTKFTVQPPKIFSRGFVGFMKMSAQYYCFNQEKSYKEG